jgi:NAD-dependent deacetylase
MREYTVIDTLKDTLKRAEKIVFLTGAGISQESGLWEKYDPMKLASAQAFRDDPRLVWRWYNDRRRKIMAVKPNLGIWPSQVCKAFDNGNAINDK